ncbi:MAG: hypothetical protein AAGA86_03445 [Bacteroidota bacterium]
MINSRNIIRQIIDIQVLAEQIINNQADWPEIEDFSNYSQELKNFLNDHVKDDLILKFVNDIPVLDLDEVVGGNRFVLRPCPLLWGIIWWVFR